MAVANGNLKTKITNWVLTFQRLINGEMQENKKGKLKMFNEEIYKELNLNTEQTEKLKDAISKYGQGEADRVRTEYSGKLKTAQDEIDKLKPVEPTEAEKKLKDAETELATLKFQQALSKSKIPESLQPFLKSDTDVNALSEALKGFRPVSTNSYIPTTTNAGSGGITKEQFRKLSIDERTKIYNESPELYQQLKS